MPSPQALPAAVQEPDKSVFISAKAEIDAAPRIKIRVHKTGDRNEMKYVFVGVNGVGYQIERGVEIDVPEPVVSVLENAVQTLWEYEEEKKTLVPRQALSYPLTRLS